MSSRRISQRTGSSVDPLTSGAVVPPSRMVLMLSKVFVKEVDGDRAFA
jgi:hypothetical protein